MSENTIKRQTRAGRLFQNFSFLTIGRIVGDAFTFLLFVVLSRSFGQDGLGQYSFAIAFTGFFVAFADAGLYSYSIKELSRHTGSLGSYYGRILTLRLLLTGAVYGVLLTIVPFLPFPPEAKMVLALVGANRIAYELINGFAGVFVASEEMHLAGFLQASANIVSALAGLAIIVEGGSLLMVMAAVLMVTLLMLFVAYGMVAKKHGQPKIMKDLSVLVHDMRETFPYGLSKLLAQIYGRADSVILGFFLGTASVGIYNAAYRLIFVFLYIPYFAAMALYPLASRLYLNSRQELNSLYHGSLNLTILLGVPVAVGLWLVAPQVINLIYGESFAESVLILRILAGLTFLATLKSIMGVFLMSCDRQVQRTKSQGISAFVNLLGCLVLIFMLGIKGAAIAWLISEATLVILFAAYLRPVLGWPKIGLRLAMSGLATLSFVFLFTVFPLAPLAVVIPTSVLIYMGALLLFSDIRRNEAHIILSLLSRKPANLTSLSQKGS